MNFTDIFKPHSRSREAQIIPHAGENSHEAYSLILVTDIVGNRTIPPTTSTRLGSVLPLIPNVLSFLEHAKLSTTTLGAC